MLIRHYTNRTLCKQFKFIELSMTFKIAIIGPGRSKQGTGPFIARSFNQLGCDVQAIVSSSLTSANQAVNHLNSEHGIHCIAYESLETLLQNHSIDIVAISSPAESHHHHLTTAIKAGCHVFCEKPLWWPTTNLYSKNDVQKIADETTTLVNACHEHKVLLQLNTQWPYTLPAYYNLYPQLKNQSRSNIETFTMWLSPQSTGGNMIIDTISHLLSMLYVLVGNGKINEITSNFHSANDEQDLIIKFEYLHAFGDTQVSINLTSSNSFPKPAAYAINDLRVDRHVELPDYLISLRSADRQLPIEDPLVCSIKNFLSTIHSKASPDEVSLIDGMNHLAQIYLTVTQT
jgi:hypothetical protein